MSPSALPKRSPIPLEISPEVFAPGETRLSYAIYRRLVARVTLVSRQRILDKRNILSSELLFFFIHLSINSLVTIRLAKPIVCRFNRINRITAQL